MLSVERKATKFGFKANSIIKLVVIASYLFQYILLSS